MVSAGGTPAAPDTQGIVEALRSQGTPPAALSNIMQSPLQGASPMTSPMTPVNPMANIGTAIGSGGLAALGGHPGTNPYLSGLQDQQRSMFYQQLHLQSQRDREAERAFQHNATTLTIEKGVLESIPEGPLRARVAESYAKKLSAFTGNPLYGELGAALATKKISTEDLNGILMDGAQGMTPQLIAARHNVPPDKVQQIL